MNARAGVVLIRVDRAAVHRTTHPRHIHPPLALKYVQAGLAAGGIDAPIVDGWLAPFSVDACAEATLAYAPRIAVIHAVTWCLDESVALGGRLRQAGVATVAVGQQVEHARRSPHPRWTSAFDHAIAGEPEQAVPELVRRVLAGSAAAGIDAGAVDVTALPVPRFDRDELARYPFPFPLRCPPVARWGYLMTSWGCPRPCSHCTQIVRRSVGPRLRERPIDAVVDEMIGLRDAGAQLLCLEDDSLPVHRRRFVALCEAIRRRGVGLPWMANARPDELDDERVEAAAAAGAVMFKVGIDSGAPRVIERIGKAADGDAWVDCSAAALARLDRAGIGAVALVVVGLPGESVDELQQTLALVRRMRADYLQVQIYRAYPDVGLWPALPPAARAAAGEYHYAAPRSNCSRVPTGELARWQHRLYRAFYARPGYLVHHLRHFWRYYTPTAANLRVTARALAYLGGDRQPRAERHPTTASAGTRAGRSPAPRAAPD